MKTISAGILILLVLSSSLKDGITYALFKINQGYLIENFCINKDKPEMACNGSCHLSEMIAENQEPANDETPMPVPTEEKTVLLCIDLSDKENEQKNLEEIPLTAANEDVSLPGHTFDIFHPPRMLL